MLYKIKKPETIAIKMQKQNTAKPPLKWVKNSVLNMEKEKIWNRIERYAIKYYKLG